MNLHYFKQTPNNQAGLTLIELMVAMVISLMLIAGTITIFISNKQAYRLNEASSRVQENGRFALDFMRRDVRMTGFLGCVRPSPTATFKNNVSTSNLAAITGKGPLSKAIDGYVGVDSLTGFRYISGTLSGSLSDLADLGLSVGTSEGDIVPDTDIIVVKRAESCAGGKIDDTVTSPVNTDFKITNNASCGFQQNEVLLVSNCTGGDIFAVTNAPAASGAVTLNTASPLNTGGKVIGYYGKEAEVYRLQTIVYYIGRDADGNPSLFKRSVVNGVLTSEELITGVEDMTVSYGVDSDADGSANHYVDATQITTPADWNNVISARIQVDVQSDAQNVVQSTTAGNDRRLRHSFTETIRIRNRI